MASNFGWVDFASENRQKMMDVVKLFREKDTVDELGIGTIRDAFANYFFPGTSTIQTRVKYMLFIPWIYQKIEKKEIAYPKVTKRARRYEIKLIFALLESDDVDGVIGQEAGKSLKRLPSEIYWAGLASWGIRLNPGSINQYHRSLTDSYYRKKRFLAKNKSEAVSKNWDPGLPPSPDNLLNYAEFELSYQQAEYLEDRIACNHNHSLLFYLINLRNEKETDYLWQLPVIEDLPEDLCENIKHARNFSLTIRGAFLLYNYLLAKAREDNKLIKRYDQEVKEWKENLFSRWQELKYWHVNIGDFWNSKPLITNQIARTTKSFVQEWFNIIFNKQSVVNLKNNREAKELIARREKQKKGSRARLHNSRALEMWGGRSGTVRLDYRWNVASNFVTDIVQGLKKEEK